MPQRPDIPDDPAAVWPGLRRIGVRRSLGRYLKELWSWRSLPEMQTNGEPTAVVHAYRRAMRQRRNRRRGAARNGA